MIDRKQRKKKINDDVIRNNAHKNRAGLIQQQRVYFLKP